MSEARQRGVLPVVFLAVALLVVALAWFRAPPIHAGEPGAVEGAATGAIHGGEGGPGLH